MDKEEQQNTSGGRGSSQGPAERVRLPGYDESARQREPAYDWQDNDYWGPREYRGYPRGYGIRASRRASTWTVAALIAGVAATTGYLAHAIPATGGNTTGGTGRTAPSPGTVSPSAPAVHPPVVTSGGSGAGGGGDN